MARILVVEDEGIIGSNIRNTLEHLGYTVAGVVCSGSEALELAGTSSSDLVLMDVQIRGEIDGIETAHRIRKQFHLPVIYLTSYADSPTLNRAKATEPFGFIVKPFTRNDIKVGIELGLHRHRLQREIEERGSWLTAVLGSIGDAIIVNDAKGGVTFVNSVAEELLGVIAHEVMGLPLIAIVNLHDDDAAHSPNDTVSNDRRQMESDRNIHFKAGTLRRTDGSERLVISSIAPLCKGDAGQACGSVMVLRDVSDYRKTERALREANLFLARSNEQLDALSHSVAHDLKEPLRAVACYSELLTRKEDATLTTVDRIYLQHIRQGCGRMDQLLSALLQYYRAGISTSTFAGTANAEICLAEALLNLQASIKTSGARIESSPLPEVQIHPTALVQIFQNLVANALKYGGEAAPIVQISAEKTGDFWKFILADEGIGFNPELSEHIFGLFKRAHDCDESGSGIGLATCRRIVGQYGGTIWAESIAGAGASFFFTLPASPALLDP